MVLCDISLGVSSLFSDLSYLVLETVDTKVQQVWISSQNRDQIPREEILQYSLNTCQRSEKESIWNRVAEDVNQWSDGMGLGLDERIKAVVIALNVIGITTIQSCEGHLDWGCPYPWVTLDVKGYHSPDYEKFIDILNSISIEEENLRNRYPDVHPRDWDVLPEWGYLEALYCERNILDKLVEKYRMMALAPLNKLLDHFYENRKTTYDKLLILVPCFSDDLDTFRLMNIGGKEQVIRSEEEKKVKLAEYQDEMNAFAVFVKHKFMNANF